MNITLQYAALRFLCIGLASCESCGGKHDTFFADVEKSKSAYPDFVAHTHIMNTIILWAKRQKETD